jgi:hypothetical protein
MNNVFNALLLPSRILYPMIRVSDLERSLTYYKPVGYPFQRLLPPRL